MNRRANYSINDSQILTIFITFFLQEEAKNACIKTFNTKYHGIGDVGCLWGGDSGATSYSDACCRSDDGPDH